MAYNNPSVADFKAFFARDFPYGVDPDTSILDADITKAFTFTNVNVNEGLFADQGSYTIGYQLLSAHYLVLNIRASSQGLNGQYNFLQQSKGAGAVNEAFAIPPRILENPEFAMLAKTNYGAQFLLLILPQLSGQVFSVHGSTRP
jgi:Protein of unknown function (DUF4054)